jgi:hypothetical protein
MRLALILAVAAGVLALSAQASARESCTAGATTRAGVTYRTFCGPARATLHFGGKTYRFVGGSCDNSPSTFAINLGTITLPPGKPKHRYFGMAVVATRDGTYPNQAVGWQFPNGAHNALFHVTVRLQGGRKRGTFSGTTLADRKPGRGTFSC